MWAAIATSKLPQWLGRQHHLLDKERRPDDFGDTTQWRIELNGKSEVAAWLACYLHAFAPITDYTQTVTFTEWGQLGIAFGVFMKRVIPVVFSVEGAALSNNVRPASGW